MNPLVDQRTLLITAPELVAGRLSEDLRVRAVWLGGSLGRGGGDVLSDHPTCRHPAFDHGDHFSDRSVSYRWIPAADTGLSLWESPPKQRMGSQSRSGPAVWISR